MEVTKRKILLENGIDRTANSPTWGKLTATTFYVNVFITQSIDDMGLFTDMVYINKVGSSYTAPDYSLLTNKLLISGVTFPFMSGATAFSITGVTGTTQNILRLPSSIPSTYYNFGNRVITGATDTKIEEVRSYNTLNPFMVGYNMGLEVYTNYNNLSITGVSRVHILGEPNIYVIDASADGNLGTSSQIHGLQYMDYTGKTRGVTIDNVTTFIPLTTYSYRGQGWNQTDVSLSALTKEEYLFGIISPPDIQSDIFIDRGITSVMDMHLRLSEIKDLDELARYGNGFYKLNKQ